MSYRISQIATLFPTISQEELQELAADIKQNGLREPIEIYKGEIIDGRNRLEACRLAGVEPRYTEWQGTGSLVAYVWSKNICRRHLTPSQRALLALDILPYFEAEAKERQLVTLKAQRTLNLPLAHKQQVTDTDNSNPLIVTVEHKGKASEDAARIVHVSPRLIEQAKAISLKAPEHLAEIKSGEKTITEVINSLKRDKAKAKAAATAVESKQTDLASYKQSPEYSEDEKADIDNHYPTLVRYNDSLLNETDKEAEEKILQALEPVDIEDTLTRPLTRAEQIRLVQVIRAYMRLDDYGKKVLNVCILNPSVTITELAARCSIRRDYLYRVIKRVKDKEPTLIPIVEQMLK